MVVPAFVAAWAAGLGEAEAIHERSLQQLQELNIQFAQQVQQTAQINVLAVQAILVI